ncbi:MAG: helix-turn-helix domain-containing protein [Proteobacteria bacterium]|nr:helix-turn-helix domain-containing protein [Pseudomonadota bacterium]
MCENVSGSGTSPNTFADNLRRARIARGWSQSDLAEKLETSDFVIGPPRILLRLVELWEEGDPVHNTAHLLDLSRIFGIPVEELDPNAPDTPPMHIIFD